jgi:hypothetical protein
MHLVVGGSKQNKKEECRTGHETETLKAFNRRQNGAIPPTNSITQLFLNIISWCQLWDNAPADSLRLTVIDS